MATLTANVGTYSDILSRMDDAGNVMEMIEIAAQTNQVLEDLMLVEANSSIGHKTTIRTGIPQGTWRGFNMGVQPAKSTSASIIATPGNLEAFSQIDCDIADLNGNTARFRASEVSGQIQGLGQQVATQLFYGSRATEPDSFDGLAQYYNTVQTATSETARNVLDAAGSGSDNASIYFVGWGENTIVPFYPKGTKAGLHHMDKGEMIVQNANGESGALMRAYVDHFKWQLGLAVRDWRYCVRIANIDVSDLNTGSAANLINLLIMAGNLFPTAPVNIGPVQRETDAAPPAVSWRIYMNRTLATHFDLQASRGTNIELTRETVDGRTYTAFRKNIPIRIVDSLVNTESRVV